MSKASRLECPRGNGLELQTYKHMFSLIQTQVTYGNIHRYVYKHGLAYTR